MDEFKEYNIMLIGLGPHAKRIYMNLFKKYKITPRVIVDLKSKKYEIVKFLEEKQFANVELVLLNDERRDNEELSNDDKTRLRDILKEKKIKYAIISTEPKAHFAYAKFLIENDINVLVDKPITAPIDVCNNPKQAMRIKTDYEKLCEMYLKKKDKITCKVQCQRRYHDGYIYI